MTGKEATKCAGTRIFVALVLRPERPGEEKRKRLLAEIEAANRVRRQLMPTARRVESGQRALVGSLTMRSGHARCRLRMVDRASRAFRGRDQSGRLSHLDVDVSSRGAPVNQRSIYGQDHAPN